MTDQNEQPNDKQQPIIPETLAALVAGASVEQSAAIALNYAAAHPIDPDAIHDADLPDLNDAERQSLEKGGLGVPKTELEFRRYKRRFESGELDDLD